MKDNPPNKGVSVAPMKRLVSTQRRETQHKGKSQRGQQNTKEEAADHMTSMKMDTDHEAAKNNTTPRGSLRRRNAKEDER